MLQKKENRIDYTLSKTPLRETFCCDTGKWMILLSLINFFFFFLSVELPTIEV